MGRTLAYIRLWLTNNRELSVYKNEERVPTALVISPGPLAYLRLARSRQGGFERDADQLASSAHARLLEQLLQRGFDGAFGDADPRGDLLVGEAFKDAAEHLLLALGEEPPQPLLFALVHTIGHELN